MCPRSVPSDPMESRPNMGRELAELVIVHIVEVQQLRQCGPLLHQVPVARRLVNRLQDDLWGERWEIHALGSDQRDGFICSEFLWRVEADIETIEGEFTHGPVLGAIQQEKVQSVWDGIAIDA